MVEERHGIDNIFIKLPILQLDKLTNLVISEQLTASDILIFLRIASFCWNEKSVCKKSASSFMWDFGKSRNTIYNSLKRLEELNIIEKVYRVQISGKVKQAKSWEKSIHLIRTKQGKAINSYFKNTHPTVRIGIPISKKVDKKQLKIH